MTDMKEEKLTIAKVLFFLIGLIIVAPTLHYWIMNPDRTYMHVIIRYWWNLPCIIAMGIAYIIITERIDRK